MRHLVGMLCIGSLTVLSACGEGTDAEVERAFDTVNVIDESNLNDIMLTVGDPNEAVDYFRRSASEDPDRIDLLRGLAKSLIRAGRSTEAVAAWRKVTEHEAVNNDDRVEFADALIRDGNWTEAEQVLDSIPPTYETYKRYRLEAMVADASQEWDRADTFYEIAVGLTTTPASTLNNWGYSKLTRGDFAGAERLFSDAIRQDSSVFTAKNNLILARGAQKNYTLPVLPTTQSERAQLLYTMALSAIKQGDTTIGRGLLRDAIDTHPQHFEAAVRSLEALESSVAN